MGLDSRRTKGLTFRPFPAEEVESLEYCCGVGGKVSGDCFYFLLLSISHIIQKYIPLGAKMKNSIWQLRYAQVYLGERVVA